MIQSLRMFLLWLCYSCLGFAASAQALVVDSTVTVGILPNGLHYYIKAHAEPQDRAELRLAVRAGSLQEADDQLGVAHFVEHLAFNGTRRFAGQELINFLELSGSRFGAHINAYTSFDETVYQLQVRTDSTGLLSRALDVLEDWASGISFDSSEIERERGVVVAEWRNRLDYRDRLQQQTYPRLYAGSRYADRLPIGSPALIDTVERATIRRYYEQWYRPELMGVIAVGSFDVAWMEAEIRRRFASLVNPPVALPLEPHLLRTEPHAEYILATDAEAPFSQLRIVYQLDTVNAQISVPTLAQQLRSFAFGNLLNQRFTELLEQPDPGFVFAGAGYGELLAGTQQFSISLMASPDKLLTALTTIAQEIARVEQHGFTPAELERLRREFRTNTERVLRDYPKRTSAQHAGTLLEHYLQQQSLLPDPPQLLTLTAQLVEDSIDLAGLRDLARHYRRAKRTFYVVTGPDEVRDQLPDSSQLVSTLHHALSTPVPPYTERRLGKTLLTRSLPAQPATLVSRDTVIDVSEYRLPNGVRLVLKPTDFEATNISLSGYSPGGTSLYPDSLAPTLAYLGVTLSGIDTLKESELRKLLAGRQVQATAYIGEHYEGISGSSTPEDLALLLQWVYLHFTAPRFDSIALYSFRERQHAILERMFDNPQYAYGRTMQIRKYNNHPRRQMISEEGIDAIDLPTARRIYTDRFSDASDFTFIMVGNFVTDTLLELAGRYLGNLPSTQREEIWRDAGGYLSEQPIDTTIVSGQTQKAYYHLTLHGESATEGRHQRYVFASLVELLRRRLRERLREEESGVYGVSVRGNQQTEPQPRYTFTLSFNCEPQQLDSLETALWQEIDHLQRQPAPSTDIQKIQAIQVKSYTEARRTNRFWSGQLVQRYQMGLELAGLHPGFYESVVDALTAEELQAAAQHYLGGGTRLIFRLVPEQ